MTILITGGAGFIGSNFVLNWFNDTDESIINLDKLTYAGNISNLAALKQNPQHIFVEGDIKNDALILELLRQYQVRAVVHFAAESHVDRSILGPDAFIQTNIVGTFKLLEATRQYWSQLPEKAKQDFRFLHVSTDEVFGALQPNAPAFTESHRYEPNSPYSASKAASDHLVRAYHHTYGLPVLTTNCSNNYGPYQFPEKLIPICIHNALTGKALSIYGDGKQIRDWLYVTDHCSAIRLVLNQGKVGEVFNIGGQNEKSNLEVVHTICAILDKKKPRQDGQSYTQQITFIKDRPGHDFRYAMDITKIANVLNWQPSETFESGMEKTINWYLQHQNWIDNIITGNYRNWVEKQYA